MKGLKVFHFKIVILDLQNAHALLEKPHHSQVQDTLTAKGQKCQAYVISNFGSGHPKSHLLGATLYSPNLWPPLAVPWAEGQAPSTLGRGILWEIPQAPFCSRVCVVQLAAKVNRQVVEHLSGCLQYLVAEQWVLIIFTMLTASKYSLVWQYIVSLHQRSQGPVYFNLDILSKEFLEISKPYLFISRTEVSILGHICVFQRAPLSCEALLYST